MTARVHTEQLTAAGQSQTVRVGAGSKLVASLNANSGNFSAVLEASLGGVWVAISDTITQATTLPAVFNQAGNPAVIDFKSQLPAETEVRVNAATVATSLDIAILTS